MSTELWNKAFLTGLFSLFIAWMTYTRCDEEDYGVVGTEGRQRYLPLFPSDLLPAMLVSLFVSGLILLGAAPTFRMMLTMCVDIFPHICLYYAVLLLAAPFLRDRISARGCGMLWLLPNYLYLTQMSYMELPRPLVTLRTPGRLIVVLAGIWLLGFLAVFIRNIVNHLRFRKELLKDAVPVTDPEVWALFREELAEARLKWRRPRLVMTDAVSTPLAIGLYRWSTRIVLPRRAYSPEELRLIFRHELIHISRGDSESKFFMMFCAAMCWFNPLMHLAMGKGAEDFELSCDETVLLGADESVRERYAELILRTAGDDRGFSTCLSASASSLRYRLRAIVKPKKRPTGALLVGLTFFLLCMTCGYVSLAYGEDTGAAAVFRGHDPAGFTVRRITPSGGASLDGDRLEDGGALTRYLAGLRTQEMTGNYSLAGEERTLTVEYESPYGGVWVELQTDHMRVLHWSDERRAWHSYHLPEPVDWEEIAAIVPAGLFPRGSA